MSRKLILFKGATGTGASKTISPQGDSISMPFESATAGNIQQIPYELVISATGGTATVQIQDSPDDSSYTTQATIALDSTKPNLTTFSSNGKLTTVWFRLNISAISSATVKAWIIFR